ncbi:MAG: hypothetical protein KBC52_00980, partial [Clostridia bacterium]|nr:hypothetical protein [Clostridia bacterium]
MIVKVLSENTTSSDKLGSEHGLSLYIETGYIDNMIAYTRNRTSLIQDCQTLGVFIATLREECSAHIDTIVV